MKTKAVVSRRIKIFNELNKLYDEKKKLQEKCEHVNLIFRYNGYNGLWDGSENYWKDFRCLDCDKRWTVYWKTEEYRMHYSHAKQIDKYIDGKMYENFFSIPLTKI